MGIFSKPKPPKASNVSDTQQQYNTQAAQTNLGMQGQVANRSGPFGSTTTQLDSEGQPIGQTSSLDPSLNAGGLASTFGAQTGMLPTTAFNPNTDAEGLRQSYVNRGMTYAQPEWQRQDKLRDEQLTNRGLPIGSEARTDEENRVGESRNQYMGDLSDRAWQAGSNEEQRQFGNQLTEYQLPGQTAATSLGLLSGMNSLAPGYANIQPQSIQPADYQGNAYKQFQGEQQNYQNMWSGIGNLAGVAGMGLFSPNFGTSMAGRMTSGLFNNSADPNAR